jgi:hypothetical protein
VNHRPIDSPVLSIDEPDEDAAEQWRDLRRDPSVALRRLKVNSNTRIRNE